MPTARPATSMMRPTRLGVAVTAAAIGLALASPAARAATTPLALPSTAQLDTALETIVSPDVANDLSTGLSGLNAGASTWGFDWLDEGLSSAISSSTPLADLPNLAPGEALQATLSAAASLLPATAGLQQTQAADELTNALSTAGLSDLLTGVTSDGGAAASAELQHAQTLAPGNFTAAGGFSAVAQVISNLAARASSAADQSALAAAATSLAPASPVPPSAVFSAISALKSVTSTDASGTTGVSVAAVARALATTLAESGAVFGPLTGVGAQVSALANSSTVSVAIAELITMASAAPGASVGTTSLGGLLEEIALTPGISQSDSITLSDAADDLGDGARLTSPSTLLSDASSLSYVASSLPTQLGTLVKFIANDLSGTPAVFGPLNDPDTGDITAALSELAALSSLGPGASVPALTGIGNVLSHVWVTDRLADKLTEGAFADLFQIFQSHTLTGVQLGQAAQALASIAADLPAATSPTLTALATELGHDASQITGTPAATSTSTSPADGGSAPATASSTRGTTPPATPAEHSQGLLEQATRTRNRVSVMLYCNAVADRGCRDRITLRGSGVRTISRTVSLPASGTRTLRLTLQSASRSNSAPHAAAVTAHATVRLSVRSAGYRAARTLH